MMASALTAAVLSPAEPAVAKSQAFTLPDMPGGGFNVSLSSMLDRRYYTVERQRYDFSCGSAALATLLHYHYGVRADEQTTFNGMWDKGDQAAIRQLGFSLLDMKRYLQSIGLQTQGFRVTLDQIAKTGVPGIALTVTNGYRHFVVIKGVSAQGVLIGDPSRGLLRMDRSDFGKIWDGLFFVITDARKVGQRSFNRPAQWAMVDIAPVGGPLSRPGEQDPLRMATPQLLFGEF
jgi:predicted double-glycine peptidase